MFKYKVSTCKSTTSYALELYELAREGWRLHSVIGHNDRDGTSYYVVTYEMAVDNQGVSDYNLLNEAIDTPPLSH